MTTIISPITFTFVNGTVIDAVQVNANFAQIIANVNANAAGSGANSDITSLSGLTTPLSTAQGGTGRNSGVPSVLAFSTGVTTLAANATWFFSVGNAATIEAQVYFTAPVAGTIKNLYAQAAAVPGAGQTYTYAVMKNGAPQTLTCQTAGGAASGSHDTTHSFSVAAGDLVTVRVLVSVTAAVVNHSASMEFDVNP